MDPNELIKQAPELLKGGAALAGVLKFTDVIKAMLGPATAEIAERFRDDIRRYRYGRQLECLKKAEQMAKGAGFTPKAVPIKLLFPLLEGASLEENEDLHTMWAALLANASSPTSCDTVRPGFVAILKQMSPDEAALFKWFYEQDRTAIRLSNLLCAYALLGFTEKTDLTSPCMPCLENLMAAQLVREQRWELNNYHLETQDQQEAQFIRTWLGQHFLWACRPPTP